MTDFLQDERVKAARDEVHRTHMRWAKAWAVALVTETAGSDAVMTAAGAYQRALDALCEAVVAAVSGPATDWRAKDFRHCPECGNPLTAAMYKCCNEWLVVAKADLAVSGPARTPEEGFYGRALARMIARLDALMAEYDAAERGMNTPRAKQSAHDALTALQKLKASLPALPAARPPELHRNVEGFCSACDETWPCAVGEREGREDESPEQAATILPAARPQGTVTWIDEQVNFVAQALKAFAHPHPNHPAGTWRPYADAARKLLAGIADRASPPSPGVSREQVEKLPRYDREAGIDCDEQICTSPIPPRDEGEYLYRAAVLALFSPAPALPSQQENLDR